VLDKAAIILQPTVDVRKFIAFPSKDIANSNDTQVPAMLIYILNIFSKNLIAHLVTEAGINPGYAEPIGIVAAQFFSIDTFMYRGSPMVDILWAKYRVVCPALWGFYGDESTVEGKFAVGWRRVEPGGPFIKEQAHAERMTGLGAGFAALTLRNFGKTTRQNPFPNTLFWQAMHRIVTLPATELQDTHYYLLNALLRNSAERIVGFFGHIGLAAIRIAIVDLPNDAPKQSTAINTLRLLRELYRQEKSILI
jgi:nucleoporin GLE1